MNAPKRSQVALGIVLAGVFGIALSAVVRFLSQPAPSGLWHRDPDAPLLVEARGKGRAWRFSYSGPDGILSSSDDPVSDDDLKLPMGADVVIQLRSDDFIYVFSCPDLKLKEIAVPDLEFSVAFRADRLGEHELVMDPMCGFQLPPGQTMGTLSVASESDFRLWLNARH